MCSEFKVYLSFIEDFCWIILDLGVNLDGNESSQHIDSIFIDFLLEQNRLSNARNGSGSSIRGPVVRVTDHQAAQREPVQGEYHVSVNQGANGRSIRRSRDAYFTNSYASEQSALVVESVLSGRQRLDSSQCELCDQF